MRRQPEQVAPGGRARGEVGRDERRQGAAGLERRQRIFLGRERRAATNVPRPTSPRR
jgi:hypothetical protein